MSTPEFFEEAYTYKSTTTGANKKVMVRGIKCNFRDIRCKYIGNKSVKDAGNNLYGINGTFFRGFSTGKVLSYGINVSDGKEIMPNGLQQRDGMNNDLKRAFYCGTFVVLKKTTNGIMCFTDRIYDITNHTYVSGDKSYKIELDNVSLAIGGTSLFPNEELTYSQYENRLKGISPDNGEEAPAVVNEVPRTAIMYYGGGVNDNNTAIMTIHDCNCEEVSTNEFKTGTGGINLYDLRGLVQYFGKEFSPSGNNIHHAIALDGSASSELAAKVDGKRKTWQSTAKRSYGIEYNRSVYMMLTVDM